VASTVRGKSALVTGGAKRLGRATALALGAAGANVVVHYRRSEAEAAAVVRELTALGARAWAVGANLGVPGDRRGLIARATELAGPLHVLVNNASTFVPNDLQAVTRDGLFASLDVNAWAPFELGRHFARAADRGHIVNLLDTRVVGPYDASHFAYTASKRLLGVFTQVMALHFAPRVAVNAVAPGLILPPEGEGPAFLESRKAGVPLARAGDPAFVAEAVLFLVTSEFITGQTIFVDGGRHLAGGSDG
jgi:NAD(P)-dependent dehydrogenase (short-subunit alcohol dehydrogenase family)